MSITVKELQELLSSRTNPDYKSVLAKHGLTHPGEVGKLLDDIAVDLKQITELSEPIRVYASVGCTDDNLDYQGTAVLGFYPGEYGFSFGIQFDDHPEMYVPEFNESELQSLAYVTTPEEKQEAYESLVHEIYVEDSIYWGLSMWVPDDLGSIPTEQEKALAKVEKLKAELLQAEKQLGKL